MDINPGEISTLLKEQILRYGRELGHVKEKGEVIRIGDGVAICSGLENCMVSELLDFGREVYGVALNLEPDFVGVVLFGEYEKIKEGDTR